MKYSLKNTIECLLLVSDEPLSISQLVKILNDKNPTKKEIEQAIQELNNDYENKAIHISQVASGFRFQAKDGLETYISKLKDKGTNKFSKAFVVCKSNNIKIGIADTVYKTGNDIKNYQKKAWSKKD